MKNWITAKRACFTIARLSVVGLILWIGWGSVASVSSLFQQRPQSHLRASTPVSMPDGLSFDELTAVDREGFWVFAGIPLAADLSGGAASHDASVEDLVLRCGSSPNVGAILPSSYNILVEDANVIGLTRSKCKANVDLLEFSSKHLRFAVCVCQQSSNLTVLGGVLSLSDSKTGVPRVYRMLPSVALIAESAFLLPTDAQPIRIASRFTNKGVVLLELAIVPWESPFCRHFSSDQMAFDSNAAEIALNGICYAKLGQSDAGYLILAKRE